jgi:hypothetical protein
LAEKLESDGEMRQAGMLRQKLARVPAQTLAKNAKASGLAVSQII